jgi:uncharacterized protein YcbX
MKKWILVGRVKALYVYPVKSFKFLSLTSAEVTPIGLKSGEYRDRHFVVANKEGKQITARDFPKFILIEPKIVDGVLTLTSELRTDSVQVDFKKVLETGEKRSVSVWFDIGVNAYDCGDEIGDWICDTVEQPRGSFRLYYCAPYDDVTRKICDDPNYVKYGGKRTDKVIFPDVAPVNIQTEGSLDDLNSRFTDRKFSIMNFRPSIYITGNGPFDEDNWAKVRFGNGEATLSYAEPCTRCIFTTIDAKTAEKDPNSEPLRTLRSYRQVDKSLKHIFQYSPVFGANMLVDKTGPIHVGDEVYAQYK